jgi:hypothetical protein
MDELTIWQAIRQDTENEINGFLRRQFESGSVDRLIYEKAISPVGVFGKTGHFRGDFCQSLG